MKKFFKKNYVWLLIFIILTFIIIFLFAEKQSLKYKILYEYEAVPNLELLNNMSFDSNGKASGKISGFVAFNQITNQPKNIKQYYEIEALDFYDKNSKQLFIYDDIIKTEVLSPKSIGKTLLYITKNDANTLTLTDEQGNLFTILKQNNRAIYVSMQDITDDMTYLITDDLKYRDFIINIINK